MLRVAGTVLLIVALGVASARATSASTRSAPVVPCTTDALSAPFSGPLHLETIDNFGCEGDWAFAWATVGAGGHKVGVTEVLHFNAVARQWQFAARADVCQPGVLPEFVYRQGCFSN